MNHVAKSIPDLLSRIEWDVAQGHAVIYLPDGRSASMDLKVPTTVGGTGIAHMAYASAGHTLTLTTPGGERATMEIDSPGGTARVDGRRVVYLDQGHWSTLARRLDDPGSVANPDDATAADKLIQWARDRRIILPLSSGHVVETTPLYGAKRQRLALTMLQLSRGWHMRNPLLVRRAEIAQVLDVEGRPGTPGHARLEIFTTDPDSLYATSTLPGSPEPTELPESLNFLWTQLTAVAANFDLLMDPERIEPEKTAKWSDDLEALGRNPEFRALPTAKRRVAAQARALTDAMADPPAIDLIQRGSLPPKVAVTALMRGLQASTDVMPFLRLYADALGVRLLNYATRWLPNDLIDMLYLACAAAYADDVCAERAATQYLNAAWRDRPVPCPVVPTLRELVSRLTDLDLD